MKQVCRAASTLLFPELEFSVKSCGEYTREDFTEILSRIAFDQQFANTGGKTLQLDRDERVQEALEEVERLDDLDSRIREVVREEIEDATPE